LSANAVSVTADDVSWSSLLAIESFLEGVFDLLAGLLEVAFLLVGLAFGLELVVAGGFAGRLLDLSLRPLGRVLSLVRCCHRWSLAL
jgi:hypothetical protein